MNVEVEPPEKNSPPPSLPPSSPPSLPPPSSPSFTLLPDEITVNSLARISRSYYPRLSILSKSFRSLTSSTQLYAARSHLGSTEQCLYVCLSDPSNRFAQWFTLWINPNPGEQSKKKQLLVSIPSSNLPPLSRSVVSAGSEIYVIGGPVEKAPSSAVRILDCGSHTWRDGPSMKVARKDAVACVHDGKIYVLGGCEKQESWAEVLDTKTRSWESLPDPGTEIPKHNISRIAEMDEKIVLRDVKHNTYGYDPRKGKWESCENITSMTECVSENVSYVYRNTIGRYQLWWSQSNVKDNLFWRDVKGLESLGEKYMSSGGSGKNTIVSCGGGKFFLIWEALKSDQKKIWCSEILLEKRHGGVLWGQIKWVDAVHTVPKSCQLLQCLPVTV